MQKLVRLWKRPSRDGRKFTYVLIYKDEQGLNGGVKVSHLAEQKCTTYLLYSRDRPGCQIQS